MAGIPPRLCRAREPIQTARTQTSRPGSDVRLNRNQAIAATFTRVTDIPRGHIPMPTQDSMIIMPEFSHDDAATFQFFADRDLIDCDRDILLLRWLHPGLLSFADWLHKAGWTGV